MMNPRKVTPVFLGRLERIARLRVAAATIPTDEQLAIEGGVSSMTVKRWIRRMREAISDGGRVDVYQTGSVPRGANRSR